MQTLETSVASDFDLLNAACQARFASATSSGAPLFRVEPKQELWLAFVSNLPGRSKEGKPIKHTNVVVPIRGSGNFRVKRCKVEREVAWDEID